MLTLGSAEAVVTPARVLDGPSADLLELADVAMAPDGTGGAIWRRVDQGRAHIFVSQFADGAWRTPQRVDIGATQQFASSWPALGAGNGGRLVAVWAQEFGVADRLYAATLQPGARRFEAPVPVDLNIGDSSLGTWPDVAVAPGGQAVVAYRVVTDPQPGTAPPGNVLGDVRAARLTGQYWTGLGAPLNRNPAAAQPTPSAMNGPRAALEQLGSGVVAWTELDDEFVSRVYARRIFGNGSVGIARQVSPRELAGERQRAVESFALAVGRYGDTAIAWRQEPSGGGDPARVLLSTLPDQFAADASTFSEAKLISGGAQAIPGLLTPAVSIAGGEMLLGLSGTGVAATVRATDVEAAAPERADRGDAAADPGTRVSLASDGSAALAWRVGNGSRQGVRAVERRADGAGGDRVLTAPAGGAVDAMHLAGSGLGDAVIGFTQGTGAARQLLVGTIDAAPQTFSVQTPLTWVRSSTVQLRWDPAASAIGAVRYSVVVDDDAVAEELTRPRATLRTRGLRDGKLAVSVIATDSAGQETSSTDTVLRVDRRAPRLRASVAGRVLRLSLVDGTGSGVDAAATTLRVGGKALRGRSAWRLSLAPGVHQVVAVTRDKAGNRATVRRSVVVR